MCFGSGGVNSTGTDKDWSYGVNTQGDPHSCCSTLLRSLQNVVFVAKLQLQNDRDIGVCLRNVFMCCMPSNGNGVVFLGVGGTVGA